MAVGEGLMGHTGLSRQKELVTALNTAVGVTECVVNKAIRNIVIIYAGLIGPEPERIRALVAHESGGGQRVGGVIEAVSDCGKTVKPVGSQHEILIASGASVRVYGKRHAVGDGVLIGRLRSERAGVVVQKMSGIALYTY